MNKGKFYLGKKEEGNTTYHLHMSRSPASFTFAAKPETHFRAQRGQVPFFWKCFREHLKLMYTGFLQ